MWRAGLDQQDDKIWNGQNPNWLHLKVKPLEKGNYTFFSNSLSKKKKVSKWNENNIY